MNLDQGQRARLLGVNRRMDRLDQRALAHAARAPEQGVVGGQAVGEALCIRMQGVALAFDTLQQFDVDAVDRRHRHQPVALGMPDEGIGGIDVVGARRLWREALQGVGDTVQQRFEARVRDHTDDYTCKVGPDS